MLFDFVAKKAYVAENLTREYKAGNKEFMQKCVDELIPEILVSLENLHEKFRKTRFDTRKTFGWEKLDVRLGGMNAGIITAKRRIEDYLLGRIEKIEEPDEPGLAMPESLWTTD